MDRCDHEFELQEYEKPREGADFRLPPDFEWNCNHPTEPGYNKCIFHLSPTQRSEAGLDSGDVRDRFLDRIVSSDDKARQFINADLPDLDLRHTVVAPSNRKQIDLRFSTIRGALKFQGCVFEPKLRLDGSRLNRFRLNEAEFKRAFVCYGSNIEGTLKALGTTFGGRAVFSRCDFESAIEFRNSPTFQDDVVFSHSELTTKIVMRGATVEGRTLFREPIITKADFKYSHFGSRAEFQGSTFEDDVTFEGTHFEEGVEFGEGHDDIDPAVFECLGEFSEMSTNGNADFRNVETNSTLDFSDSSCHSLNLGPQPDPNCQIKVELSGASIHTGAFEQPENGHVYYDVEQGTIGDIEIDLSFDTVRFIETDFTGFDFSGHRRAIEQNAKGTIHEFAHGPFRSDGDLSPDRREVTYQKAKSGADAVGDNRLASRFFVEEMRARRARPNHSALPNLLLDKTCRYGESPSRVFATSVGTILLFGVFFAGLDLVSSSPEPYSGTPPGLNYLLLSLESFTGLVHRGGPALTEVPMRSVAAFEAFVGAFLIALFLFTLTRSVHR